MARPNAPGRHHRYCDRAGDQAAEKGDDEIEPGREHQERAPAALTAAHQLCRKRTGAALEFREGQRCLLAAI